MNYNNIYVKLITRAQQRQSTNPISGYSEKHHILPRCKGGTNDPSNIVALTPEEHYLAHLLLVKMYPGDISILWAVIRMTGSTDKLIRSNKLYGWTRRKFAEAMRKPKSEETRKKMSEYWSEYRRLHPVDNETRKKMSDRMTGTKRSAETKQKMSDAKKGVAKSEAHKQKMSDARKGKAVTHHNEETKHRISEHMKEVWKKRRESKQEQA